MSVEDVLETDTRKEDAWLHDGHGNSYSRRCPDCGNYSMYIALPNDFRCRLCYKETYVKVDFNA